MTLHPVAAGHRPALQSEFQLEIIDENAPEYHWMRHCISMPAWHPAQMKWAIILVLLTASLFCAHAAVPTDIAKPDEVAQYKAGESAARKDMEKGLYKYEIVGLPRPEDVTLPAEAKKQYGITIVFHGCIPGPNVAYDRGYLDTVVATLKKKHGFDPVQKLSEDLLKQTK
ncbi:MAG: hypothetical protein B9S32_13130 [Verrucomicrobia bacterium Tous-C9LFEB]|nr:MAG: hypothetical protein B9S32_13130 [Verrucomicrobia bacterium Tous-C9LFEB]